MPELPEVETVKRGLNRLIIGKKIQKIVLYESPRSFPNNINDVKLFVEGATVVGIKRRAKLLFINLSSKYTFVVHLKMTGQLVYVGEERFGAGHPNDSLVKRLPDKSTRVSFEFTDNTQLFFNDQRKFGWVKLYPTAEVNNIAFMQKVGPEPLENSLTDNIFIERVRHRNNSTVKATILDQSVIAGIGNIYADESLWLAKIHPATKIKDLSDNQLKTLLIEIKAVLNLSIKKGGSTSRNYVNAEGGRGSYMDFARVYKREGKPCFRHPNQVIQKIRVAGRGTHVCPQCQPM